MTAMPARITPGSKLADLYAQLRDRGAQPIQTLARNAGYAPESIGAALWALIAMGAVVPLGTGTGRWYTITRHARWLS